MGKKEGIKIGFAIHFNKKGQRLTPSDETLKTYFYQEKRKMTAAAKKGKDGI